MIPQFACPDRGGGAVDAENTGNTESTVKKVRRRIRLLLKFADKAVFLQSAPPKKNPVFPVFIVFTSGAAR